jgi:iron-sulfur cluster assembly accessory protein
MRYSPASARPRACLVKDFRMTVETFDVSTDVLSISPEAARHLKAQVERKGVSGVRISVKESGCTGYMYVMEEVDRSEADDVTIALDNGVSVFVDAESIGVLRGTKLDYVREGINRTLKFKNPNVTAACGCGESFSIE